MIIIPGFQKTGSTTLYEILSQSDDIYAPEELKDFHFFGHETVNSDFINTYRNESKRLNLHCAVNYVLSYKSIENVISHFPDSKFVVIVRDPIQRAISSFYYFQRMGLESRSLEEALLEELENSSIKPIQEQLLKPGLYFEHLEKNILSQIPANNVSCFLYEDIFPKGGINISSILDFIHVSEFKFDGKFVRNKKGIARWGGLNRVLFQKNHYKTKIAKLIPLKVRSSFKKWLFEINISTKEVKKDQISSELNNRLINYFYSDCVNLSKSFNLNLEGKWMEF